MCVLLQVLHLIGMALLEEQQQLENIGDDDEVTFNFTLKISRKFCTSSHTIESLKPVVRSVVLVSQVPVKPPATLQASWLC